MSHRRAAVPEQFYFWNEVRGGRNVAASADGGRISDCCEDLKP